MSTENAADRDGPVPDWPRPDYEDTGRSAELMYLVVGPAPAEPLQLSRARHRVSRIEPGLVVSRHRRGDDPAWFDGWLQPPLGAEIDALFSDPDAVRAADHMTVVRGRFPDPPDLNYLRNAVGVVSAILDTPGALAAFDAVALAWWKPSYWRAAFVDSTGEFRVADHVSIAVTDHPEFRPGYWTHTRGMAKFARPDLHIKHVPGAYSGTNPAVRDSGHVLHGLANYLAQGAELRDGQTMFLPTTGATITFLRAPADGPEVKAIRNSALEVCDFDEGIGQPLPGAQSLLEKAARRRDGGE